VLVSNRLKPMKNLLTLVLASGILASCQKQAPEPSEDTAALHTRFHGKYQLLSAVADVPVDLNRDGQASTNLVEEIPDVKSSDVILLIPENRDVKMFEQFWPQPNVTHNWNYSSPDSLMVQGYAIQIVPRYFAFNKSVTNLVVESSPTSAANDGRFPVPEVAVIEKGDQLRITVQRSLFTHKGWQLVRITTTYKRYTSVT
jgi:hypothetical protein